MNKCKYSDDIRTLLRKIGFSDKIKDTDFFYDMGMDSILFVRLIIEVELKFNIEYPDEYLSLVNCSSISKLNDIIESELKKQLRK